MKSRRRIASSKAQDYADDDHYSKDFWRNGFNGQFAPQKSPTAHVADGSRASPSAIDIGLSISAVPR
jgi:hypothetical protein